MGDYFIGELRVFTYSRVPKGWIPCDGRLLPITGNAGLFALLSNVYGGDGKTTFGVPDLRGRVTMGTSMAGIAGQRGTKSGAESVVLTTTQVPAHDHQINAVSSVTHASITPAAPPNNNYISEARQLAGTNTALPFDLYGPLPQTPAQPGNAWAPLDGSTLATAGGNAAHENRQPVLPLQICISSSGIWPSRN